MGRDLSSSKTGASRQSRFDRITVVRNLRTEIKFRFTENEAARSAFALLIQLICIHRHRIWTTTHAFPFLLWNNPVPPPLLSLPRFHVREPRLFKGRIETSNFEATRERLPPKERFNIRATSRDSPLWPGSFWNLAKTVSTIFALLRLFHPCFTKKWMETVRYGNSFARRRNPGCYCRTELTFRLSSRRLKLARVHRPIPELHLRKPVITFLLLPFPIDAAISEITLRINHRQPNRKLSQRSQLSLILG